MAAERARAETPSESPRAGTEPRPSEHAQKIVPAPQCAELGLFLVPLRPFFSLLVLAPLLEFGGIGRSLLFECNSHLSDAISQLGTSPNAPQDCVNDDVSQRDAKIQ